MTDLPTLAATLLTNFATVRIPSASGSGHGRSQTRHSASTSIAVDRVGRSSAWAAIASLLRQHLLDDGHRAFFDRIEGDGPDGWRLHFFCLDPRPVTVLHAAELGECGPGDPVTFRRQRNSSCVGSANWSDPVVSTSRTTGGGGFD